MARVNDETKSILITMTDELRSGNIITNIEIKREGSLIPIVFEYNRTKGTGTNPDDILKVLDLCNVNYKTIEERYKL